MLTQAPKIPAWIDAEVKTLIVLTNTHNVEKLRERRANPKGVNVDIYHHSAGTDSYFCDVRKRYLRWREILAEADMKIACGQYLFTAVIEYKEGLHFISSLTQPNPSDN
jgi:hypothetical protein